MFTFNFILLFLSSLSSSSSSSSRSSSASSVSAATAAPSSHSAGAEKGLFWLPQEWTLQSEFGKERTNKYVNKRENYIILLFGCFLKLHFVQVDVLCISSHAISTF